MGGREVLLLIYLEKYDVEMEVAQVVMVLYQGNHTKIRRGVTDDGEALCQNVRPVLGAMNNSMLLSVAEKVLHRF